MSNRQITLLAVLCVLLLGAGLYYYYRSLTPRYDWDDSWTKKAYKETSAEPYGTQVAHRLLKDYFPGKKQVDVVDNVAEELPRDSTGATPASYVFVGEAMYLDSVSTARLLEFVQSGHTALISSKTIPFDLMFHLYYAECGENGWDDYTRTEDSIVTLTLRQPVLSGNPATCYFARQNKTMRYNWHYIEDWFFCDSLPQQPLGYMNQHINFAEFPFGKGRFLLHTTPIAFSNFSLLRPEMRTYTEGVLSYLEPGDIYWDAVSRVPEAVGRRRNNREAFSRTLDEEHPLSYILKQPALAWAWYLLVAMAGIWLFFRGKRRQRIIPVLPKNENSSYQFISTIANLHFRERNYQGLSQQNMRLFLAKIRERYNLIIPMDTATGSLRIDGDFVQRLAVTSEVPEQQIQDIFRQYAAAVQFQPTEQMAVDLYVAMEKFWKMAEKR
jgi:hypothetical protein